MWAKRAIKPVCTLILSSGLYLSGIFSPTAIAQPEKRHDADGNKLNVSAHQLVVERVDEGDETIADALETAESVD